MNGGRAGGPGSVPRPTVLLLAGLLIALTADVAQAIQRGSATELGVSSDVRARATGELDVDVDVDVAGANGSTDKAHTLPGGTRYSAARPRAAPVIAPAPPAPGPWIAHLNVGFVAFNWVGARDGQPSQTVTVADRQSILQLAGFGYFVRPSLRVMLSLQFVELVGGGPPGASTLSLVGAIPWVGWHPFAPEFAPLFVGAGPLLAPRSYGKNQFDAGLWTAIGVGFPIGSGFALGGAVQVPTMFKVRTAVTIAPAAFVAYRFGG